MDEREWLTSNDLQAMLRHLTHETHRGDGSIVIAPRDCPLVSTCQLRLWVAAMAQLCRLFRPGGGWADSRWIDGEPDPDDAECEPEHQVSLWLRQSTGIDAIPGEPSQATKAAILRDIIGNPFRPVVPCSSWLTPTVLALATALCADLTDGTAWAALADELEAVGCEDEAILRHCRGKETRPCRLCSSRQHKVNCGALGWFRCPTCHGTGERSVPVLHVRGCWVLDLLTRCWAA